MSDLDKALSQANKVMARKPATPEDAPKPHAGKKIIGALLGALIFVMAIVGGYALWLKLSEAKTHAAGAKSSPSQAVTTPLPAHPSGPTPTLPPPPVDPVLATAFEKMALNAILADPPRAQLNGKIYELKSEILPGLTLIRVEKNAIVAQDAAGATYRRTF